MHACILVFELLNAVPQLQRITLQFVSKVTSVATAIPTHCALPNNHVSLFHHVMQSRRPNYTKYMYDEAITVTVCEYRCRYLNTLLTDSNGRMYHRHETINLDPENRRISVKSNLSFERVSSYLPNVIQRLLSCNLSLIKSYLYWQHTSCLWCTLNALGLGNFLLTWIVKAKGTHLIHIKHILIQKIEKSRISQIQIKFAT